jgi:hypothetical protein
MIEKWHALLGMEKHDETWYRNDLEDEVSEYHSEQKMIARWSELSDIAYVCTRAQWSGVYIIFPFNKLLFYLGVMYMIPKYTARWFFFRQAGKKLKAAKTIREVRNPKKTHKLHSIAEEYGVDIEMFQRICEKQLKYWPLLP